MNIRTTDENFFTAWTHYSPSPCNKLQTFSTQKMFSSVEYLDRFLISDFHRVLNVVCFLLGNSLACILYANVSEHSVPSSFIKFRHWGITQKKAYNILISVCLFDVFIDFVHSVSVKLLYRHLKLFLLFLKIVCCYNQQIIQQIKVKVIPQQAKVAQGVLGRLRPWIFLTFGTTRVVGCQPYAPAAFTPGEIPGTHFQRLSRHGSVSGSHGNNPQWHHRKSIPGPSD